MFQQAKNREHFYGTTQLSFVHAFRGIFSVGHVNFSFERVVMSRHNVDLSNYHLKCQCSM
jgi:hypothetical protein